MFAKDYLPGWKVIASIVIVVAFAARSLIAGDEPNSPSENERKAVAVLAGKGSVIFIDGEYQVTQILGGRDLTNEDIKLVREFKKLKLLSLSNSKIDEASVATLKTLLQLQSLTLPAGAVSEQAHQELKTALPNCRIVLPERRGFGSFGGGVAKTTSTPSSGAAPGWGPFEFPPITPAPSMSVEIRSPAVQERLKISSAQKQEIDKVTGRDFQRQQTEEAIKKVLTAEQKTLMQQVLLQREGPTALVLPEVAQDLKLTSQQRSAIQKIMDERRQNLLAIGDQLRDRSLDFPKSMQATNEINSESNKRLLAVLSDKQLQAWNAKIGPPLPGPRFGEFPAAQSVEETARSIFRNLDRNGDGQLAAEEWHRSRSTRTKFENAKIALEYPVNIETFVKRYLQLEPPSSRPNP